eukprot:scaffold114948_cov69-Phaeocystis_antarctica.AAC.6
MHLSGDSAPPHQSPPKPSAGASSVVTIAADTDLFASRLCKYRSTCTSAVALVMDASSVRLTLCRSTLSTKSRL